MLLAHIPRQGEGKTQGISSTLQCPTDSVQNPVIPLEWHRNPQEWHRNDRNPLEWHRNILFYIHFKLMYIN